MYCMIQNVALPLPLDDSFSPLHLEKAFNYYPDFLRHSGLAWSFQGYVSAILKEIDKAKPNDVYDGDTAFGDWLTLNGGIQHFGDMVARFKVSAATHQSA